MAQDENRVTIQGSVDFLPRGPLRNATAFIRVRDVSLADAAAPIVAEQVVAKVSTASGTRVSVPFNVAFSPVPGVDYNIEAHISASGGRDIKAGDYLTMQSYPVVVDHQAITMRVEARPIG